MLSSGAPSLPIVMVVLDGLGDRRHAVLGNRTPAEAAHTPNLDALARLGRSGLLYPIAPGFAPSSHQAHFALFGYDLERFPGRGLLEALGEGVPPEPGEVVVRASFAKVVEREGAYWIVERPDPRTGDIDLSGIDLDASFGGVSARFVHTGGLQGLLFLRGESGVPLSHFVSDADPLEADAPVLEVLPLEEAPDPDAAARTAHALNAWMRHTRCVLAGRPLDFALVKWAGERCDVTPFEQRYGLRGVSLGAGPLYAGLAAAVGLDHLEIPTHVDPFEDVRLRTAETLRLLEGGHEFIHLHTKHPDVAGHSKDPQNKADVIAEIDRALEPLVEMAERGRAVVTVCADHQTPSAGPLYHGGGPVPLVIAGGADGPDAVDVFGESACAHGCLGTIRGVDVLPLSLDAADRTAFMADRVTRYLALGIQRQAALVPLRPSER